MLTEMHKAPSFVKFPAPDKKNISTGWKIQSPAKLKMGWRIQSPAKLKMGSFAKIQEGFPGSCLQRQLQDRAAQNGEE